MTRAVFAAGLAAAIIAGAASGCGGGSGSSSTPSPSSLHAQAPETFSAKFDTTKGPFVVDVTRSWAPKGADRFYNLVKSGFYDDQPLFRVVPGFVVQWGISGDPTVSKAWENAKIKDDPVTHSNEKGTITFANAGNDTRTTQVFVNTGANTFLDSYPGHFAPFGTVSSGYPVIESLYSGYGEATTNKQPEITQSGASWVRENFPKLDWIKTARLVN